MIVKNVGGKYTELRHGTRAFIRVARQKNARGVYHVEIGGVDGRRFFRVEVNGIEPVKLTEVPF